MGFQECVDFANENKVCYVGTSENNHPRVRGLLLWFADEKGFYFQTASMKELYGQLKKNPKIEVCFYKTDEKMGKMLRVSGTVEFLDDLNLKTKVIEDRPFLKVMGVTPQSPELIIFRISKGKAHFWTMENNLKPKDIINFSV
ncbi:MAG: pyridoxamine 5'-phosphate oxidase family protein [Candidatus Firestonebacteria bacterium]